MKYSEIKKQAKKKVSIMPSGVHYLDETLDGGFRNGSLIALLGREESGKTIFLEQILLSYLAQKKKSAYFALEFSDLEVINHIEKRIESGIVSEKDIEKMEIITSDEFSGENKDDISIDNKLLKKMKILHELNRISIFGIDSTMALTGGNLDDEFKFIRSLIFDLYKFAKETNSIVFIITQKSKAAIEKREASIYGSQFSNHLVNMILNFEVEDGKHTIEIAKNKQNGKKAKYEVELNRNTLFFELRDDKATKTTKKEPSYDDPKFNIDTKTDTLAEIRRKYPKMAMRG